MPSSENRRTSKACDPCKRRKVKCNGQTRCQQCTHAGLPCTYTTSLPDQPRKKAVRRGTVIAECRTLTSKSTNADSSLAPRVLSPHVPQSIASHPNPAFFLELLSDYEQYVYPMSPVITADSIHEMIMDMTDSTDAGSFAYIFAAVTMDLTRSEPVQDAPATRDRIAMLLTRSLELRRPLGLDSQPSVMHVMRDVFTEMSCMTLRRPELGHMYLREAISLLYMLNAHSEDDLARLDLEPRARLQRAYWECFIHERFTALTYHRPTCLNPLKALPDHDVSLPADVEIGFNSCIKNFCLVDRQFLDFWLGDRSGVTAGWVEEKQSQLEDIDWHCEVLQLPKMQQADLIITRHWLRTLTWQMGLSNTLLSSSPGSSILLSLSFPLRLSNQLRQFLTTIPRDLVGIHGSGILKKLFEIASTIADVVIHTPYTPGDDTVQRIHDILFLKKFVYSFAGLQSLWPELLTEKFEMIRDKYPGIKEMELLV
ncbi:hypothetical protein N7520_007374 [Penicillium odoratum]|uniref:uncharacterized protein n=1 Tax=Penicillium odoratum TaxID=1167516 RepID=UPI002546919C|nr:uncharacterized protein N7520_007374 [Penicillium odoratum]KAJ5760218.1 hypothetical protein N7520_007374 [Penicillium odoratum]